MEKRPDSGHPPGEVAPQPNQGWRKLWDKVLLFLEIISLRAERKTGDYAAQLPGSSSTMPSSGDFSPPTTLVGTLARILKIKSGRYGLANACVGGGQGVATIIEREP